MGIVYLARDTLLDRDVALKEARDSGESADRLRREIRILSRLEHPNIVPLHDQGTTPDGRPCYTMRLIRGRTLAEVLAETPALDDRLPYVRALLDAARAAASAHQRGVIHRDLKPANLLIGESGELQVVDWGLAALLDPGDSGHTTLSGAVLGTPAYMAPEQARGLSADARADIYALGAILAEILTGRPPRGADPAAALILARDGAPIDLPADLPADLAAVARKALAANPADRYPSARALADDLDRWLNGRPVLARSYPISALLRRWVSEHRRAVAIGLAAALLLIAITAAAAARVTAERARALAAERDLTAALADRDRNLAAALTAQARAAFDQSLWPRAEVLAARALALSPSPEALGVLMGVYSSGRPLRVGAYPTPPCEQAALLPDGLLCLQAGGIARMRGDLRQDPSLLQYVWRLPGSFNTLAANQSYAFSYQRGQLQLIEINTGSISSTATGSNYRVYTSDRDWFSVQANPRRLANAASSAELVVPTCPDHGNHQIQAYLREERFALICDNGWAFVGDLQPPPPSRADLSWGAPSLPFEPSDPDPAGISLLPNSFHRPLQGRWLRATDDARSLSRAAAFTPDGKTLVIGHLQGDLITLDLTTGASNRSPAPIRGPIRAVWPLPDSRHIALVRSGGVEIRRLGTDTPLLILPGGPVFDVRFPDERTVEILTAQQLQVWRLPTTLPAARLTAPLGLNPAFPSPDGLTLAATHDRGAVSLWSLPDGAHRLLQTDMAGVIKGGAFSDDGRTLALTGTHVQPNGTAYPGARFDAATLAPLAPAPPSNARFRRMIRLLGDHFIGTEYLTGIWEIFPAPTRVSGCPDIALHDAATSADHRWAVVSDIENTVLTLTGDPPRCVHTTTGQGGAVDIANDGQTLLIGSGDQVRRVSTSPTAPGIQWEFTDPALQVTDVAISGDARYAAASAEDGSAWLLDGATGKLLAVTRGHSEKASGVEFSPDGRAMLTSGWDSRVMLWSLDPLALPAEQLLRNANLWDLDPEALLQDDQ